MTRRVSEDFFREAEFLLRAFFATALSMAATTVGSRFRAVSGSFLSRAASSFLIIVLYLEAFARL